MKNNDLVAMQRCFSVLVAAVAGTAMRIKSKIAILILVLSALILFVYANEQRKEPLTIPMMSCEMVLDSQFLFDFKYKKARYEVLDHCLYIKNCSDAHFMSPQCQEERKRRERPDIVNWIYDFYIHLKDIL